MEKGRGERVVGEGGMVGSRDEGAGKGGGERRGYSLSLKLTHGPKEHLVHL